MNIRKSPNQIILIMEEKDNRNYITVSRNEELYSNGLYFMASNSGWLYLVDTSNRLCI